MFEVLVYFYRWYYRIYKNLPTIDNWLTEILLYVQKLTGAHGLSFSLQFIRSYNSNRCLCNCIYNFTFRYTEQNCEFVQTLRRIIRIRIIRAEQHVRYIETLFGQMGFYCTLRKWSSDRGISKIFSTKGECTHPSPPAHSAASPRLIRETPIGRQMKEKFEKVRRVLDGYCFQSSCGWRLISTLPLLRVSVRSSSTYGEVCGRRYLRR